MCRWITAQVCSDIINLGSRVTFLGQFIVSPPLRKRRGAPTKWNPSHYSKRKKECKEKGGFNCWGSNLVRNILSCLNLWKMTNFYKIRLDVTPGHNATFKSYKSGTLQCDAEKRTTAKPHFSTDNLISYVKKVYFADFARILFWKLNSPTHV